MFRKAFTATFGVGCAIVVGIIAIIVIVGALAGGSRTPQSTAVPLGGAQASGGSASAAASPTPAPTPVALRGTGQMATDAFRLPAPISVAAFTHTGRANFAVWLYIGESKNLLVNTIGSYTGSRPMRSTEPVRLQIEADGPWTVNIAAIVCCASSAEYAGHGDSVSNQFNPPSGSSTWEFANTGKSNYAVWARCAGGDNLIQNRIGAFQGSAIITFQRGPCYWDVVSDGDWSMKPR